MSKLQVLIQNTDSFCGKYKKGIDIVVISASIHNGGIKKGCKSSVRVL